ncbi:DyP-type peroxidase [Favolaschia claudopus]|uniref:DyP-type peroxidase n=1 Tax=Favolaschia claudopus TaxID=2862362 RepID=A0AAW0E7Z9_9AGAR
MKLTVHSFCIVALFTAQVLALRPNIPSASPFKHRQGLRKPSRLSSLLINPDAHPNLPTSDAAASAANAANLNLDDIQGDILIGMKKNQELFYFFSIEDPSDFKPKLASDILPNITSTSQLLDVSKQPVTMLNIAFSATGLSALGVNESLGDSAFAGGQFKDSRSLGDPGSDNWVPEFAGTDIHGVLLFASDSQDNINDAVFELESALGGSIKKVYSLAAAARTGSQAGHEHFGFLDGISNPAVEGFNADQAMPGQARISSGTILLGESGDFGRGRPAWAKDGSFLVFRQLKQLVPEFNKFLVDNPIVGNGLTREEGSELLGARMMGRWKSGAPIDLAPLRDDPELGADPLRNNNFTYAHADLDLSTDQSRCPFSAHTRKTRPRADQGENLVTQIMRAGIPYGPEVSDDEAAANTTSTERGLAFVAYQSNIGNGFRFMQQTWANSIKSALHLPRPCRIMYSLSTSLSFVNPGVGVDPIIGSLAGAERVIKGMDPSNANQTITLTGNNFVISRGGEYMFAPSLSAIASKLSV